MQNYENPQIALIIYSTDSLASCKKKDDVSQKLSVERYIQLLKTNKYTSSELPEFSAQDIPALLNYRNDTQIISKFPTNPISSYSYNECKLGTYVLWTIESIRIRSLHGGHHEFKFPSQNAILGNRNITDNTPIPADVTHQVAAQAYFDWWENNKQHSFDHTKTIDPLQSTNYRWR